MINIIAFLPPLIILFMIKYHIMDLCINLFMKDKNKGYMFIQKHNPKFFRHDGLMDSSTAMKYPQAKVEYEDGMISKSMPLGNAYDYASIFKGKVIFQ